MGCFFSSRHKMATNREQSFNFPFLLSVSRTSSRLIQTELPKMSFSLIRSPNRNICWAEVEKNLIQLYYWLIYRKEKIQWRWKTRHTTRTRLCRVSLSHEFSICVSLFFFFSFSIDPQFRPWLQMISWLSFASIWPLILTC